jgi:preprotein translocase subunit SecB
MWCEGAFMTTTNGGPTPAAAQDMQPQLTVVSQYIKDFSFENPNAPKSLAGRQEQPQIGIQINVGANPLSENDIEVVIKLDGKAEAGATLLFRFELEFAGVFRIRNVPQESMNPVVIECPRLLFPFAREIIATAVRNGGFPPLLLDPVDFVGLYRQKMAQQQPAPAPARG